MNVPVPSKCLYTAMLMMTVLSLRVPVSQKVYLDEFPVSDTE